MRHLSIVSLGLAVTMGLAGGLGCSTKSGGGDGAGNGGRGAAGSTSAGGSAGLGGASGSGGATGTGGGSPGGTGGATTTGGTGGAGRAGGAGGGTAVADAGAESGGAVGGADGGSTVSCSSSAPVVTFPGLPGAVRSPLYTVTANGTSQFVEKLTRFAPEMQVHYAYFEVASGCTASISVTVAQAFSSFMLSPKSRSISVTKNGNTLTFSSGPNYLILQIDAQELLFILIDDQESRPPKLGDANVKNIADYTVDNTGASLVTTKIQTAINAASGAAQNILYFPPGRYKVGELAMKSNMTLYLAAGALLDGSTNTADYNLTGAPAVENTTHAVLHLNNVTNAKILGRGVIDGNGTTITAGSNGTPPFKINAVRIDQSSKILLDGILVRDPVFWNTLIYKSDQVTIQNYKVINRRPTTTTFNQTDGVDFDASTNGTLFNAFLYTGDDNMATKTEQEGGIDTRNIVHQKVVGYSNSAGCKIGTKTFGAAMDGVVFKDIDVVKAGRAIAIDANDTAVIQNTMFQNIRVEAADEKLIDVETDRPPTFRTAPNTSTVKDVFFTSLSSEVNQLINIHGESATVNVNGVHFSGLTVQGQTVTSQTDTDGTWDINQFVSNVTFQ